MLRKNFFKTISWCLLVSIILVTMVSTIEKADKYLSYDDYFETDVFKSDYYDFLNILGPIELNTIDEVDKENLKRLISISPTQISDFRNSKGSLSEQLNHIQAKYDQRITEAKASNNEIVTKALTQERDQKVEEIQKIFLDDDYVKEKIKAKMEDSIDLYVKDLKSRYNNLHSEYSYFAYELTNVETGETFSNGKFLEKAAFVKEYNSENGYLSADKVLKYINGHEVNGYEVVDQLVGTSILQHEGKITIPISNALSMDNFQYFKKEKLILLVFIATGIVSLFMILFLFRFQKSWFLINKSIRILLEKWPLEIPVLLLLTNALFIYLVSFILMQDYFRHFRYGYFRDILSTLCYQLVLVGSIWIGVYLIVWIIEEMKDKPAFSMKIKKSFTVKLLHSMKMNLFKVPSVIKDVFFKTSLGFQVFVILVIIFFWGFITMFVVLDNEDLISIYSIGVISIGIPTVFLLFKKIAYLNRLIITTEKMVEGKLLEPIPVKGNSAIAKHAANLNQLRVGFKASITEQAKSERLKTELITNVSHDLRTPLTSIITYTDLLKNPKLAEEVRSQYVKILERKSHRMKTLIEDLFEVSKMASGSLELHKQEVDLTQLLQQVLGEHQDEMSESNTEFRINTPAEPIMANVDGQRWWRVLDNLIVNAMKYSLQGTRVYVSLKHENGQAEFVIKNVTKYELGENINELLERFKRADTSRHTEGSGLGLAIAQSIVDLHGGLLKIDLDGDLFKVTVQIQASTTYWNKD
ncbi:sensor histidine kinase [Chengkuizengella axinellae]|uniref:histidine kinase n=1 Tax=Chengkuizengella axinellae TaxID=3064388 RepID=A0ABT9ITC8_9BACL|nr:histidine kinase dimerization/phospho-acceptor domain-containing protein [Chengkuizengella sp. 2205SS18-9]MDP5272598.1 histidine kinase dimerization/phospho-acceptor domain-containing protein [Chengkuizengella sp. 2205SS18-9]